MSAIQAYDTQTTIHGIQQLNLTGNILPHTWLKCITFENGKPDLLGMMILAEIIYWYRPYEIKREHTGELLGYSKKFKADKLQRSITSFVNQFGASKRQVSDALKRLDDGGLITRELRTIDTSHGKLGNVLFIAPVVEKLIEIESRVPLMQSNAIGGDELDNPPESEDSDGDVVPLCNQTHKGNRSNAQGYAFDRCTYTKTTTQITTENTAAATSLPKADTMVITHAAAVPNKNFKTKFNSSHPTMPISGRGDENSETRMAASPSSKQSNEEDSRPVIAAAENKNLKRGGDTAEPLIDKTLTALQLEKIKQTLEWLERDFKIANASSLFNEVCHGLLDPKTFSRTGNNFPHKLQAIVNSIKNSTWSTPASFVETKQKQKDTEVNALIGELNDAASRVEHAKKMVSFAKGNEVISAPYVKDIPKFTAIVIALKEKLKTRYNIVLQERT